MNEIHGVSIGGGGTWFVIGSPFGALPTLCQKFIDKTVTAPGTKKLADSPNRRITFGNCITLSRGSLLSTNLGIAEIWVAVTSFGTIASVEWTGFVAIQAYAQ